VRLGGLGNLGVAIAIFKGNLGSNILFMPHSWQQGGYLVGGLVLPVLAFLSVACIVLLIRCREGNAQSYGDLMERATGKVGRAAVDTCVVFLQVGTCCAYLINVSKTILDVVDTDIPSWAFILIEAALVAPLVLIRNVMKLSLVNLVGGALTMAGILLTFGLLGRRLGEGAAPVQAVNQSGVLVAVGIACFTFEGIGLVIPIYDSCRNPQHFTAVYSLTIGLVAALITAMSALGYFAFGEDTQTLVLLSLPDGALPRFVQVTFCVVMLASLPLQLLPAVRIVEGLFLQPSRPLTWDKHIKSLFRIAFLALLAGVSIVGATSLDHFVSFVGAVCGLPLAFIFPAICHRRLVARPGSCSAYADLALVAFGLAVTLCVGIESIVTWGA